MMFVMPSETSCNHNVFACHTVKMPVVLVYPLKFQKPIPAAVFTLVIFGLSFLNALVSFAHSFSFNSVS